MPKGLIPLHSIPAQKDYSVVRDGVRYSGVHLIIDLYGASRLNDLAFIEATMRDCVKASGATLLHIHLHPFEPNGVSGVAVLAESHISVHTWPELDYAAFDVFMCGNCRPDKAVAVLERIFAPRRAEITEQKRGLIE